MIGYNRQTMISAVVSWEREEGSTHKYGPHTNMERHFHPPIVFPHECPTGPTAKRSEPPLLTSMYVEGGKTLFIWCRCNGPEKNFMLLRSGCVLFASLRAMSIFVFYYYFYFTFMSQISCVEHSSNFPAERLWVITHYHTKRLILHNRKGGMKPFYI